MRDHAPAHPEQMGRMDLDPSVRARIDRARQNLEATTYRPATPKIPSVDRIDPKLQAYLQSIRQSLVIEYEVGSMDVSGLFDEFLLHADAIAMVLRMNDANQLEQGLVQIAHQAVTKLARLNVSLFQSALTKNPNIHQVRPSDVFTCGVLFTDRLLQGFGHESVFNSKNAFEENIAHAILADSLVHVCRLKEYDPRVAVAEITGLFDRVKFFDVFYPWIWHKNIPSTSKEKRNELGNATRTAFVWNLFAQMFYGVSRKIFERFQEDSLPSVRQSLILNDKEYYVRDAVAALQEKYHRIQELQRYIRSQGYEWIGPIRATAEANGEAMRLVEFVLTPTVLAGITHFDSTITQEWDDSALDPLCKIAYPNEWAAKQAAHTIGRVSFELANGNTEQAFYRPKGKQVSRVRRTIEKKELGDILSFRMTHDPQSPQWAQEFIQKAPEITLILAALQTLARALMRKQNTPASSVSGKQKPNASVIRPVWPKQTIIVSFSDRLPTITPYVPPKKLETVVTETKKQTEWIVRNYTIPEEGWRDSIVHLPAGKKPQEQAFLEGKQKRKPLKFIIVRKDTGETMYRPYPPSYKQLLDYLETLREEFPEADYTIHAQTYRRSTGQIRREKKEN